MKKNYAKTRNNNTLSKGREQEAGGMLVKRKTERDRFIDRQSDSEIEGERGRELGDRRVVEIKSKTNIRTEK